MSARARRADARAATRGDILPADRLGATTFPRFSARAAGAYVWDVDGHRYIDYLLGYGPVILGHAHPVVTAAVSREVAMGNCMSPLWSPRQVELTELLGDVIPGADLTLLLKTGSDATSAAVRLARIFTGREKVVRWGYNGWHDWSVWQTPGVPRAVRETTLTFDYTENGLRDVLGAHPGEVAAVVMMPFEFTRVPEGLLDRLAKITHDAGALLIFDEMRSGFRMALGGAQEFFGVSADIATFSKAMANGFAISAVTGRREILECLAETKISSTFFAGGMEMAAAIATIQVLRTSDALEVVWTRGRQLQEGLRELVRTNGVRAQVRGYPPFPFLEFNGDHPRRNEAMFEFFGATTRGGILLHPDHQWFVSAAHTEEDVEVTLEVCRQGVQRLVALGLT